ncbi:diguanylate cyclase (GGDEF) domain-containing protein [Roseivivax marinus]|uniref:diguanylate cyclase domain-containing protein n=1 Tax=Roseivivax marinus TaxID=1379903 RepID=UPI0008B570F3|nr:GGDEF domain-containing protein [Roseivivax marinus]SEK48439.1 diguanylate cyclase (GGDEF) domain-containing protein [Roseivivax marinus]
MTGPDPILDALCPMHLRVDLNGRVIHVGPTLRKILGAAEIEGAAFFQLFTVRRPRGAGTMAALVSGARRRAKLELVRAPHTPFVAQVVPEPAGGAVINLSFGIGLAAALGDHALTSADFAPTDLTVEMLFLIESKSAVMASALERNARLHSARVVAEEQALTDTLTGLGNRRAVDLELARLAARRRPFALMHLDLDHFKAVNDTFGHAAGDHVLQEIAQVLGDAIRTGDVAARLGGDEFLLILSRPPSPRALELMARRLVRRIEEPIHYRHALLSVSASVGIARHDGTGPLDLVALFDSADAALYAAKSAGRGRVSLAPSDRTEPPVSPNRIAPHDGA